MYPDRVDPMNVRPARSPTLIALRVHLEITYNPPSQLLVNEQPLVLLVHSPMQDNERTVMPPDRIDTTRTPMLDQAVT